MIEFFFKAAFVTEIWSQAIWEQISVSILGTDWLLVTLFVGHDKGLLEHGPERRFNSKAEIFPGNDRFEIMISINFSITFYLAIRH